MSFLSRDALDGPGDAVRPSGLAGRPSTAGRGGRSPGGEATALLGSDDAGTAASAEVQTPTSQVNMREKMLLQRQKMMAAKQRQMAGGAGSMVLANSSAPASVPTPMGSRPGTSPTGGSRPSNSTLLGATSSSFEAADVDRERARLEANEDGEKTSLVTPQMTPAMKEEEARRRSSLQAELSDRGICPEYDPMDGAAPDNRSNFDVSSIMANEMRPFLHNPMIKTAGMLQCRIVRDKSGIANRLSPKYVLESDSGVFLMAAQKQAHNKTPNYAISMAKGNLSKNTDGFLGKLRSDVCGLQWTAYGPGLNPGKADNKKGEAPVIQNVRDELISVQYSASFWGTKPKGPRKMMVSVPRVQPNGERLVCRTLNPQTEGLVALAAGNSQLIESFTNKSPKWNDTISAYVLNFNKRVTEASVKNFQLVNSTDPDTVYLQFGKVGKDAFNIDFRYPISPFQAFAICLTAFEYKLGCE
jgi:hypothetical protein